MKKLLFLLFCFAIIFSLNIEFHFNESTADHQDYAIVDYNFTDTDFSLMNTANANVGGCSDRPYKADVWCYSMCGGGPDYCSAYCGSSGDCSACWLCYEWDTPVPVYHEF